MKKKGVSPVIATVLLITMVFVVGLVIFLWFKGMNQEIITKFDGTNIELVCGDVSFDASYSFGELSIVNNGNVPIYGMDAKIFEDKGYETVDLEGFEGLSQGGSYSQVISFAGADKVVLVPILLGSSEQGKKTFKCDESQYGYEILV